MNKTLKFKNEKYNKLCISDNFLFKIWVTVLGGRK